MAENIGRNSISHKRRIEGHIEFHQAYPVILQRKQRSRSVGAFQQAQNPGTVKVLESFYQHHGSNQGVNHQRLPAHPY